MELWLQIALEVAGAVITLAGFVGVVRHAVRLLHKAFDRLVALLEQIRDASKEVRELAREVRALSGAVVTFSVELLRRQDDHARQMTALRERCDDLAELYVDLSAAVARNRRHHQEGTTDELPR